MNDSLTMKEEGDHVSFRNLPIVLVTGSKDSGKTSLASALIRLLRRNGRAVLAFKRAREVESPDSPATDTARFAAAGATVTGLTWPGGTYVAFLGASPAAGPSVARRLDRPLGLEELTAVAADLSALSAEAVVVAEGFSESPYPRLQVLAQPGRPEREAAGPVLGTWTLPPGRPTGTEDDDPSTARIALLVEDNLSLLARWAAEASSRPDGAPARPGSSRTTAAVLAGGRGRRLGGAYKWGLPVGGKPQSRRCLEVLTSVLDRVIIVGGGPPDAAAPPTTGTADGMRRMPLPPGTGLAWLEDDVPGEGPLGGLLTALRAAGDRDALVLAGDMPFVSQAFLRHLVFSADLHRRSFDIIVPRWGPYLEPLHAIYSPSCLGRLRELRTLHGTLSGRRVTDLFTDLRVTEIMETEIRLFGDPRTLFLNLNTPEDLARAETMAASEEP